MAHRVGTTAVGNRLYRPQPSPGDETEFASRRSVEHLRRDFVGLRDNKPVHHVDKVERLLGIQAADRGERMPAILVKMEAASIASRIDIVHSIHERNEFPVLQD